MTNTDPIADKIRTFRKEQNMSQDDLATKSGINVSTIKKYEIGDRKPKLDQLLKIASALGVSINEFLTFEISTIGDVLSILMRLDEQTDMDITSKKAKPEIIYRTAFHSHFQMIPSIMPLLHILPIKIRRMQLSNQKLPM